MRPRFSTLFSLSIAAAFAGSLHAQSIWGTDIAASGAINFTGPFPCSGAPVLGGFPFFPAGAFPCPTVGPFGAAIGPPGAGDITLDRATNTVWVTDGVTITNFTRAGAIIRSIPAPGGMAPITGLGWGLIGGLSVLVVTGGPFAAVIVPPAAPGCVPAAFLVPPTPLPIPGATDIDYDPVSGTFFYTTLGGLVVNLMLPGGAIGPFGIAPAGVVGCPLAVPTGIAVDTSTCGTLYVTDGALVQHRTFGGALSATPYTPPCFPVPFPGVMTGLGFDAAAVPYGMGCDPVLPDPVLAGVGQALTPAPGFGTVLSSAVPGSAGVLLVSGGIGCPPVAVGAGCPLYAFPAVLVLGPFFVPAGGTLGLPLPIPAGIPCGLTASLQWYLAKPGGGIATSNPIELTVAQP
jgi:hypothetical protein